MQDLNSVGVQIVRCGGGYWRANRVLDAAWFRSRVVDLDLWYIYAGRGWIGKGDRTFELRPGTFMLFFPGEDYREGWQDESDRLGVNYVHFHLLAPTGERLAPDELKPAEFYSPAEPSHLLASMMRRVVSLYRISMAEIERKPQMMALGEDHLKTLLGELLWRLSTGETRGLREGAEETRFRLMDGFLERLHVGEKGAHMTVEGIARDMGMSTDHFIRSIKKETGRTPKVIILEMRMEEAKHLLERTTLTVSEIAYDLGYEDVFSFSRQFKGKVGLPPSEFRERMAADAGEGKEAATGDESNL